MSSLTGHAKITRMAIRHRAAGEPSLDRVFSATQTARQVVARDVVDLFTLGHWRDFAQCHHFMRRFDGQSDREAYEDAVRWIANNAADAARMLAAGILRTGLPQEGGAPPRLPLRGSRAVGNALHALQDSFAPGHAEREPPQGGRPGAIRRVRRYAGAEKQGHAAGDAAWRGEGPDGFSDAGRLAARATHELLRLIVEAATHTTPRDDTWPAGFEAFRGEWLRASADLPDTRTPPIGFFRRF